MEDEKYVFFQDLREKKVTGYSARKQRSHCGKGGRVKFPSDYLTKKELKNMSGECKSYRMNSPMKWQEFKAMPKDLQIAYIKAIKEKYDPPVVAIAKMMDADRANLSRYLISLGFEKQKTGQRTWDKMGFAEWCFGVPKTEECQSVQEEVKEETSVKTVEEVVQECVAAAEEAEEILTLIGEEFTDIRPSETDVELEQKKLHAARMQAETEQLRMAIPSSGRMSFDDNANNILIALNALLGNKRVMLSVSWDVVEE